jgi:hypothetical protein
MDAKSELIDEIKRYDWFHTIDFGGGIVTPGHCTSAVLKAKADSYFGVSPKGKTVLDFGCWDGYSASRRSAGALPACWPPIITSGTRNAAAAPST